MIALFIIIVMAGFLAAVLYYCASKLSQQEKTQQKAVQTNHDETQRRLKIKVESEPSPGVVKELKFFYIKDKGYHVSVWPNVDGYVDLVYIEFNIAGIIHHREAAMNHLGETMGILVAEPDNPYDSNAIRVMTPDWQCVGYVPKDRTDEIREHTTLPCQCLFYIGINKENDEQIFYTDAYIRLDMLNNNKQNK